MNFQNKINTVSIEAGSVGIFYLAQAGFCFKTAEGRRIFIDPYLSDACERLFGFKRMIPAPLAATELQADLYLITHHHADHLDPDALPVILRQKGTHFIIAPDCVAFFEEHEVPAARYTVMRGGDVFEWNEVRIRAIYADHGELAPDAVGYLLETDGIRLYHAGDTALRIEEISRSLASGIDVMIAPINGTYGNMIAREALQLATVLKPSLLIPCHFWMFLEHVVPGGEGDPATFLAGASSLAPGITCKVMAPGELLVYSPSKQLSNSSTFK